MSIDQLLILRTGGTVDTILGWLYIALGLLILLSVWHFTIIERMERKQARRQALRERRPMAD